MGVGIFKMDPCNSPGVGECNSPVFDPATEDEQTCNEQTTFTTSSHILSSAFKGIEGFVRQLKKGVDFAAKAQQLGFNEYDIKTLERYLSDDEAKKTFISVAEEYLKTRPNGQIELLSEFYHFLRTHEPTKTDLTSKEINNIMKVYHQLTHERGFSSEATWFAIRKLEEVGETFTRWIGLVAENAVTMEQAIGITHRGISFRPWHQTLGIMLERGYSLENAMAICSLMKDYDPRSWEHYFVDIFDNFTKPSILGWLEEGTRIPEWLSKIDIKQFADEIEAMGIEPAEVINMLLNSDSKDIPKTKDELYKIIGKLHEQNGINSFGRYSMKILNAAYYPSGGKRNAVVIYPAADYSNVFYSDTERLEQLVDEGVMFSLFEVKSDQELVERVQQSSRMIPIDLLVIAGHGDKSGIQLDSNIAQYLLGNAEIDDSDYGYLRAIGTCLGEDAQIVLDSCSTGGGFAQLVHDITGKEVFANTQEGGLESWHFDANGRVGKCVFVNMKDQETGIVFN